MAIISDADTTTFIRSLLGEATAKHWTDAEITLYKNLAMVTILSKYWYLLAPTEAKVTATSLVANTDNISLPTDCAKVLKVEVAGDGKMLRKIEVDELWKYEPYDDGAASTNYLNIWYLKYYDTVTDFPETLRPLIAIEAAKYGKAKDTGALDMGIMELYKEFEEAALAFLSTDSMYEPAVFSDSELIDTYTSTNPVAWVFRDGKIYLYKYSND